MFRYLILLLVITFIHPIFAAEITNVIDAFDGGDSFDANIEIKYYYKYQSSKIKREYFCNGNNDVNCQYEKMGNNGVVNANNFEYTRKDHVLEPIVRFGLYKDLEIYFSLPIYLSSKRNLGFDSSAKKAAMDTNRDGIVDENDGTPTHNGAGNTFWNYKRTGTPETFSNGSEINDLFFPYKYVNNWDTKEEGGQTILDDAFPNGGLDYERSGIKTLNVGLKYDILENDRDNTDPTWLVGIEYRAPVVSPVSKYSTKQLDQIANRGGVGPYTGSEIRAIMEDKIDLGDDSMGDGIHTIMFETALSKRFSIADPFLRFFYEKNFASGNSAFKDHANREYYKPGDLFGFDMGVEIVPWERAVHDKYSDEKRVKAKFSTDIRLSFSHQMKGMMFSELTDYLGIPTVVSDYSSISGSLDLRFMPIEYVNINLGVMFGYTTDHYLTDQPRGIDHDGNGQYDTDELDPAYSENKIFFNSINSIGNRILATETFIFAFNFLIQIQF